MIRARVEKRKNDETVEKLRSIFGWWREVGEEDVGREKYVIIRGGEILRECVVNGETEG